MVEDILTQVTSTAVVIGIAGYILRTWVSHQLEKMSTRNDHQLALRLESAKADWSKEIAKLNIHESYLHQRRVEVIEKIYKKALEAEFSLQNFLVTWWANSNKEEIISRGLQVSGSFSKQRGIEFCEAFTEINAMLHRNALYFDDEFVDGVVGAYKPYFDVILDMPEDNPPPFPEEFKDVVASGQAPRNAVIRLFREALGVVARH